MATDRKFEATKVIYTRHTIDPDGAPQHLAQQLINLMVFSTEKKLKTAGQPFAVYHKRDADEIDVQFCLPVEAAVECGDKEAVKYEEIAAFDGKSIVVDGPPTGWQAGYDKVEAAAGQALPKYEVYVKGAKDKAKPADFKTELIIPNK
eukprot:CAMPEP_0198337714 /NCGR_PEP_ID=MMETSP1450-20131203/30527_1 /TAXON_ID=753684 ORGANISM="Madagascaria erythrocladiodes, Strain CCMP3234" /NCGR_SAMPLE_ID=MMETSP1450 /ASSEMBLY_ACC=CAM_ASM_001115 /LENGTH=147 /DNA_ID=CAMNT_0044042541 /DNA_START=52 /DNA_END=495 /DNA_ORIENTATION=+